MNYCIINLIDSISSISSMPACIYDQGAHAMTHPAFQLIRNHLTLTKATLAYYFGLYMFTVMSVIFYSPSCDPRRHFYSQGA